MKFNKFSLLFMIMFAFSTPVFAGKPIKNSCNKILMNSTKIVCGSLATITSLPYATFLLATSDSFFMRLGGVSISFICAYYSACGAKELFLLIKNTYKDKIIKKNKNAIELDGLYIN